MADQRPIAKVIVSETPDAETARKIEAFVKERGCGGAEYIVDADILGGIVISVGGKVYDGSLRSRLEGIRRSF